MRRILEDCFAEAAEPLVDGPVVLLEGYCARDMARAEGELGEAVDLGIHAFGLRTVARALGVFVPYDGSPLGSLLKARALALLCAPVEAGRPGLKDARVEDAIRGMFGQRLERKEQLGRDRDVIEAIASHYEDEGRPARAHLGLARLLAGAEASDLGPFALWTGALAEAIRAGRCDEILDDLALIAKGRPEDDHLRLRLLGAIDAAGAREEREAEVPEADVAPVARSGKPPLTSAQRRRYMHGGCRELALAIHDLTGWGLVATDWHQGTWEIKSGGASAFEQAGPLRPGHFMALHPSGVAVDAYGAHERGAHPKGVPGDWQVLSREEVAAFMGYGFNRPETTADVGEVAGSIVAFVSGPARDGAQSMAPTGTSPSIRR
jgi:hypothetical protein